MMTRTAQIALVTAALIAAGGGVARGDGTVLSIDVTEIYVDLGSQDGVAAGSELEVLHDVIVRDPVTNETLRDRFPLGRLEVVRVGERVCVARAPKDIAGRIRVGNPIVLASARKTMIDPWQARVEATRRRAGTSAQDAAGASEPDRATAVKYVADAEAARAVWQKTLGQPPRERIKLWQEHLVARRETVYADAIRLEIVSLEQQATAVEQAAAARSTASPALLLARRLRAIDTAAATDGPLAGSPPTRVVEGQPIDLAFAVVQPDAAVRAWLYVRGGKDDSFRRYDLVRDGDATVRATIPAEVVTTPRVDFFVETAAADGEPAPTFGSSEQPVRIDVRPTALEPPPELHDRSRVTLTGEYVDFDGGLADGFDQYYQVEADFMYRFLEPVYAVRLGFGSLSGLGGPKDVIDEDPMDRCRDAGGVYRCRQLTYSYIYTEVEHRFSRSVAVMLRPQAGLLTTDLRAETSPRRCTGSNIEDCLSQRGLGARARVRFGEEMGTNLALGVGITDKVGTLFEAAYMSAVSRLVPIQLAVQVTDQPIQEDFGVRLVGDVGFRAVSWFYPYLRLSYQARDVDHAGFSGGLGASFDW